MPVPAEIPPNRPLGSLIPEMVFQNLSDINRKISSLTDSLHCNIQELAELKDTINDLLNDINTHNFDLIRDQQVPPPLPPRQIVNNPVFYNAPNESRRYNFERPPSNNPPDLTLNNIPSNPENV